MMNYSLTILVTALTFFTFSQIEIYENGGTTDYSGGEYYLSPYNNSDHSVFFTIVNSTGIDQNWVITRKIINASNATWEAIVWWPTVGFGEAYQLPNTSSSPWTTPLAYTILNNESAKLDIYITRESLTVDTDITYRYYVGPNETTFMDSVDVKFEWYAALDDEIENSSISISPNPTSNFINLTINNEVSTTITLVDVLGKVSIKETMSGSKTINVSDYKNGIYFLRIESDGVKAITRKIIVRH